MVERADHPRLRQQPLCLLGLDKALATSGRTRQDLDICQGAEVNFAPDEEALQAIVGSRKKELAFSLGGMGSSSTNFYNQDYSRQGWAETAAEVHDRWQAGDHDGAAALVTDETVLATTLIGTESMVRERIKVWQAAGVDTIRMYPAGDTLDARLATLGRAIELVHEITD
jgi:alkanesulfonate monooxygenase SsuD/methylene tetrahydromethanopterin reductase-like flavin-dependent oxidoreductase (luciferase family)